MRFLMKESRIQMAAELNRILTSIGESGYLAELV